jgi:hypothetical protein
MDWQPILQIIRCPPIRIPDEIIKCIMEFLPLHVQIHIMRPVCTSFDRNMVFKHDVLIVRKINEHINLTNDIFKRVMKINISCLIHTNEFETPQALHNILPNVIYMKVSSNFNYRKFRTTPKLKVPSHILNLIYDRENCLSVIINDKKILIEHSGHYRPTGWERY